jgi:predicted transport protein
MANLKYTKHEKIFLKGHPTFNEVWLQDRIAEDPSILGFGDLILKDRERIQPKAGRLDLLLQDQDSSRRYEVEVQLGSTDESHIIRTIEYWDVERKRYPQYDHTAVIVAEDITSRFLNVIGLFNGFIPLVAIQMNAIKIGDQISLICTTVLDQMTLGLVEEDEEKEVADRSYWENRGTKSTVKMADKILELIQSFASNFSFKYLKFYIGGVEKGQTNNFVKLRPQKNALKIELKMNHSGETEKQISEKGLDLIDYTKWGRYRIRLLKSDLDNNIEFITELLNKAYAESTA